MVTGHPAQFISQSYGGHHLGVAFYGELERLGFDKDDFKTIPCQEVFNSDVTVFEPMYDEYFIEHITPQVENARSEN